MGLKRGWFIAKYRYSASSHYCTWFQNTSQREFPINPNVVRLWYAKNKHSWSWWSWLSIMYQTLANGGTCQKVFWHHHTVHQQLSFENSLAGTKNNKRLLQYLRTKNRHCYRHQTVDVGDSVGNKIDRLHVVSGTHSSESYYRTSIWPRHPNQVQRAILQPVFWYHQGLTILPSAG